MIHNSKLYFRSENVQEENTVKTLKPKAWLLKYVTHSKLTLKGKSKFFAIGPFNIQ